jgi:hypothetical protein
MNILDRVTHIAGDIVLLLIFGLYVASFIRQVIIGPLLRARKRNSTR